MMSKFLSSWWYFRIRIAWICTFRDLAYERLRARALVLLLRHTALRIGDAYRLRRDAITAGRIRLYTSKSGIPVNIRLTQELAFALEVLPPPDPLTQHT